jgi:hypothetical protein
LVVGPAGTNGGGSAIPNELSTYFRRIPTINSGGGELSPSALKASLSKSSVFVESRSETVRDCGKEFIEGERERGLMLDISNVIIK